MSSNWRSFAEKWRQGQMERKDVVIEAVLEGQIAELETYLSANMEEGDPATETISEHTLERDCCRYAYELLQEGNADKAVQLLSTVKDPKVANDLLKEALVNSFDRSVRKTAANYLRSKNELSDEDENILEKLEMLSDLYPGESFKAALEKHGDMQAAADRLESAIRDVGAGIELKDDMVGMFSKVSKESLWGGVLGTKVEIETQKLVSEKGVYPYMSITGEWLKGLSEGAIHGIVAQGEALSGKMCGIAESDEQKWKNAFQHSLTHHMVAEVLKLAQSVPKELVVKSTLQVFDGGEEVLSFGVDVLNVDLSSASILLQRVLGIQFLSQGIWLTTRYDDIEPFLSLSAQSGLLLATADVPFDLIPLYQDLATAKIVIRYCSKHGLSHVLQQYLENHAVPSDQDSTLSLLQNAQGCHWVQWLILSRIPDEKFATVVANARAVLPSVTKVNSLSDLAESGSAYMLLSALANLPGALKDGIDVDEEKSTAVLSSSGGAPPELRVVEGLIQIAIPSCSIASLNRCLENFPSVRRAFHGFTNSRAYRGKVPKPDYLKWRNNVFGGEGLGLLDLIPTNETTNFATLLKMCAGSIESSTSGATLEQDAANWEREVVIDMHEWLGMVAATDGGTGIAVGVCHRLMSGNPMAALQWYLTTKEYQVGESMEFKTLENKTLCLPSQDLLELGRLTRLVALQMWQSPRVVAACMVLACACGVNVAPLKVDVTALQKLRTTGDDMSSLIESFYKEVQDGEQGGAASQQILEMLEKVCSLEPVHPQGADQTLIARAAEGSIDSFDSMVHEHFESNQEIMMQWSLVHAFAAVHGLKPNCKLLEELAKCDDWILFLAESGAHEYDIEQILEIARDKFTDPCLGHHVSHILTSHVQMGMKEHGDGDSKDADTVLEIPEMPKSQELFEILVEAEKTGLPGQALLKWGCQLNWQLLTVVAACCPDVPMLSCLVAWLDIFAQSDSHAMNAEVDPEGSISIVDKLAWHVHNFCKQDRFGDLLEAFQLFPVVSGPLVSHFLNGLRMFAQHMLPAAELRFKAFRDTLAKSDGHDQHGTKSVEASTPSGRSTLGSSPSMRDMRALDPSVEADLIDRICQTSALSVLHGLPSAYEKEKFLEMLAGVEVKEGCTWPSGLRALMLAYKLLGSEAEQYITWRGSGASARPSIRNAEEVLAKLEKERKWIEARQWGQVNDVNPHEITRREAEALIQEWEALGLWDDLHEMLWEEVHEIFKEHMFPAVLAGVFFLQQGVKLQSKVSHEEVQDLLVRAISWLKGDVVSVQGESPLKLVADLRRALFLIDGNPQHLAEIMPQKESVGGRYSRSMAVQMILKAAPQNPNVSEGPTKTPKDDKRVAITKSTVPQPSHTDVVACEEEALEQGVKLLKELVDRPSKEQLDKTVKILLDLGEIDDAKKLGNELPIHPINFFLVDTAMAIIHTCGASGWSGSSVEGIAMTTIINFLRGRRFIASGAAPQPQEVLDAVAQACMDGGGQSVCTRAAITYRASTILETSCEDLAALGPYKMLEMLLGKGEEALDVACRLGAAFELTPRSTARMLAQMLLKRLLDAQGSSNVGSTTGDTSRQSRCDELMANAVICNDWIEVGNALMQLLVERHLALPSEVEADILAMAYQCYERCEYAEGVDVLLELAGSRIEEYASGGMYEALVKLITGLGRYENMQQPIDLLVQHNQLEGLLNAAGERGRTSRALRSAVLTSAHHHNLSNSEELDLVHEYFSMHVEIAKGLESHANEKLREFAAQNYPARDPVLLHIIGVLMRAAEEYTSVESSLAAARCSALLALVAQQSCFPDRHWVCLNDSAARDLLPQLPDYPPALVLGRAYQFNTPQDWVLTLWQHMVELASGGGRSGMFAASTASMLMGMHSYAKSVIQEVDIEDHLDQVVQMFLYFRDHEASYGQSSALNKEILAKCFAQLLQSVPDYEQRLALCTSVGGAEVEPVLQDCLTVLGIDEFSSSNSSQGDQ